MADISITTTNPRTYKDISLSLLKNPVTSDVTAVTGVDAVRRSVRTLLQIRAGEVPFLPDLGAGLDRLLFEPIDPITTAAIEDEIRGTLTAYEPRISIVTLTVTPTEDEQQYQIDLKFLVVNMLDPVTLTLFLTRQR